MSADSSSVIMDLIDTLWNVKYIMMPQVPSQSFDLIDTLWNVKTSGEGQ